MHLFELEHIPQPQPRLLGLFEGIFELKNGILPAIRGSLTFAMASAASANILISDVVLIAKSEENYDDCDGGQECDKRQKLASHCFGGKTLCPMPFSFFLHHAF